MPIAPKPSSIIPQVAGSGNRPHCGADDPRLDRAGIARRRVPDIPALGIAIVAMGVSVREVCRGASEARRRSEIGSLRSKQELGSRWQVPTETTLVSQQRRIAAARRRRGTWTGPCPVHPVVRDVEIRRHIDIDRGHCRGGDPSRTRGKSPKNNTLHTSPLTLTNAVLTFVKLTFTAFVNALVESTHPLTARYGLCRNCRLR